jgi:hypothetical protein
MYVYTIWRADVYNVMYGLKAGTCASAGRSFARHVLVVTRSTCTPLMWVLLEPFETHPW